MYSTYSKIRNLNWKRGTLRLYTVLWIPFLIITILSVYDEVYCRRYDGSKIIEFAAISAACQAAYWSAYAAARWLAVPILTRAARWIRNGFK